jgi:hypothetical protein
MAFEKRTYYKAWLLLIVFSLNTVVSFACSFSSLFHGFHHHNSSVTLAHQHKDGTQHEHKHAGHHHDEKDSTKDDKKDCCSQSVVAVEKVEKAMSRSIEAPNTVFLTAFIASYTYLFNLVAVPKAVTPHYERWRVPTTIQDLRIVIQSFQI